MFWFTELYCKSITLNTCVQCLDNWRTTIGYGISEAEDELKLVDNNCTRYPSQLKIEQTQERISVDCI